MKLVVSTLPISPRSNLTIGSFTLPVLVDLLAGMCGRDAIVPINILGSKSGARESMPEFLAALNVLKVDTAIWIDEHEVKNQTIQSMMEEGFRQGWLSYEKQALWVCPCGKTEVMDEAESLLVADFTATTYELAAGQITCRLCQQAAVRVVEPRLLMTLPHLSDRAVRWRPSYCEREIKELLEKFRGRKISLSRKRETGLVALVGSESVHLDPDLAWMMCPAILEQSRGVQIETLVVGHKTIKHAAYSLLCSSLLGATLPKLVLSAPYMSVGEKPYSFREASTRNPETLRCLLAFALGSRKKSITLDSKWIYWIEHSIRVPRPEAGPQASEAWKVAEEIWDQFSQQAMTNLLAKLRSRRAGELTPTEQRVLRTILKP